MTLDGTVYFDFGDPDCFRLFGLVTRAGQEGADIGLAWQGRPVGDDPGEGPLNPWERLLAAHALVRDPGRQERFRGALFVSIHRQGDSPEDELTHRAAARVAGVDLEVLEAAVERSGRAEIEAVRRRAVAAGAGAVPTIVGAGPPLRVITTPVVDDGPATPRIEMLAAMLEDDGVWRLEKP